MMIVPGVLSWLYLRSAPRKPIDSVAVLPLAFPAIDSEAGTIGDQVSRDLAQRLSETRDLTVARLENPALNASEYADARKIGHELGVRAIIRGHIERQEAYLLLTVELADAGDNAVLWSRQYRFRPEQIAALQDELARHLSRQIRLH